MGFIKNIMESLYKANPMKIVLYIFIAVSLWMVTGLFKFSDADQDIQEKKNLNVKIVESIGIQQDIHFDFSGKTRAELSVKIRPEIDGVIESLHASNGDFLKQGEIIAVLEVENKKHLFNRAKTDLESANIQYKSAEITYKKKLSSRDAFIMAKSRLRNAEASFERAKSDYDKIFIKAPFDGYVEMINVEKGDFVSNIIGSIICDFTSLEDIRAEFYIPRILLDSIKLNDKVSVTDSDNIGYVHYIAKKSDPKTFMFKAEALIHNPKNIKDGEIIEISVATKFDGLLHNIAKSSISLGDLGEIGVKVVDESNIVRFKPVEIKDETDDSFLVSGLGDVEKIIVLGGAYASPGEKVNIEAESQS